jgi:hypothetical protein
VLELPVLIPGALNIKKGRPSKEASLFYYSRSVENSPADAPSPEGEKDS